MRQAGIHAGRMSLSSHTLSLRSSHSVPLSHSLDLYPWVFHSLSRLLINALRILVQAPLSFLPSSFGPVSTAHSTDPIGSPSQVQSSVHSLVCRKAPHFAHHKVSILPLNLSLLGVNSPILPMRGAAKCEARWMHLSDD